MRSLRTIARLNVVGATALGLAATVGTATPAHADVRVTCAALSTIPGTVFGSLCFGATAAPQRGTIADSTQAYSCLLIDASELGSDATAYGCTRIR